MKPIVNIFSYPCQKIFIILLILSCTSQVALSQSFSLTQIPEQSVIQNTDGIRERAESIVKDINKSSNNSFFGPGANKTEELRQVRSVRTLLSKRLYELKGYAENLKSYRGSLIEQLQRKVPTEDEKRAKLEGLNSDLEDARFEKINAENGRKVFLGKQQDDRSELSILQSKESRSSDDEREIKSLIARIKEYDRSSDTDRAYYENELKKIARRTVSIESNISYVKNGDVLRSDDVLELRKKIDEVDTILKQAQNVIRLSDDTLASLDETAGILLQTDLMNLSYSDRSTWVFGLLVGGVIFGFFVIAARSERVRDVVFTGDSGIQFITLFSLVIAIILFGILRILEGKELAALLGGLSGYILGKSTHVASYRQQKDIAIR